MAECSYSRCVQQKRNIRRELQRWTKAMVHIVGLERIAEELMGRRKWKLYQESMSRNYLQPLNNNVKSRTTPELPECRRDYSGSDSEQTENKIVARDNCASEGDARAVVRNGRTSPGTPALDWKPQDKCHFCVDGKLDSEPNSQGVLSPRYSESDSSDSHSDNEAPASLTPPFKLNNNHHHHHQTHTTHPTLPPNMTTIENMALAVAAFSGQLKNDGNSPGTATPHIPFYPSILNQSWYLANVARTFQNERLAADVDKNSGEQPLDLSKGSSSSSGDKATNNVRLPTLETKHIFKAKPRMPTVAGRRTYTEEELQAALRDIQSGKLGTRRAAVIYGIPRSTLRNKVYKLALERERESHLNSAVLKIDEDEVMEDEKELSGAEEEKEIENTLKGPLLTLTDIMRLSNVEPEVLKSILQRSKEGTEPSSHMEQGEIGSYIQNLILASQKPPENSILNHAEFLKRMIAEEHLMKLHKVNGDNERLSRPGADSVITKVDKPRSEPDMDTESESSSNVILKIPSFKPTISKNGSDLLFRGIEGSMVSPPVTSESNSPPIISNKLSIKDVKDVIAHSISQKFQQPVVEPIRRPIMEMDFKSNSFTPPLGSSISVIKTNPQEVPRVFPQHAPPKPQQQNSTGQPTGGKGTRPKRGKYRNYDRDSLVEAVRAVQRGEMSVHRAGSYYGVPHSTLEYKVKERHLMRPRKRDPKPNPVDEKIASLKQNDIRNAQEKLKNVVMKPPQKFPPTSPNGMKLPMFEPNLSPLSGYNPPPFPFWAHPTFHHIPLDYGRSPSTSFPTTQEFFASQMMQKLQEETSRSLGSNSQNSTPSTTPTLAKSARQMAESLLDGTGSNVSFLDGIIRSSLESGVPSHDEKMMKEESNVAPENMSNKALLDQLCRNSRLTPLSKPSTGDASSGDESYRKENSSPLNFAGATVKEEKMDDSPPPYERENSSVHTIELSNDSHESIDRKPQLSQTQPEPNSSQQTKPPGRIYLKQDLVNPNNLKPEMLVRFIPDIDRNGVCENPDSASENEAPQD